MSYNAFETEEVEKEIGNLKRGESEKDSDRRFTFRSFLHFSLLLMAS